MFYSNKKNRIDFIKHAHDNEPTTDFIRDTYINYFAIKKAHKDYDVVTCTRCGKETKIKKKQESYVCQCGLPHSNFKSVLFKNFNDQIVIRSESKFYGKDFKNYYLVFVGFNGKLVTFTKPLLIAKKVYFEEKNREYHYNIAYRKSMGYRNILSYDPNKNITETKPYYGINAGYFYYSDEQINFKYINYYDINIKGYEMSVIKDNEYLIEILQKFKSSYLFNQLMNRTRSKKLIDLFNMRDVNISNKLLVKIIKYFSKHKNLDISIYKDYLNDLKIFNYKFNRKNLMNKNYKAKHREFTKRIKSAANEEKNKLFKIAYRNIEDVEKNGVYIIAPKCMEDLEKEGEAMKHCVGNGTYANRVIKGESKIFFVRKNPDQPLITAEVNNTSILQFRGYDNRNNEIDNSFLQKSKKVLTNYLKTNNRKEQVHATN